MKCVHVNTYLNMCLFKEILVFMHEHVQVFMYYSEIHFVRGVPIFVVFTCMPKFCGFTCTLNHEMKNKAL